MRIRVLLGLLLLSGSSLADVTATFRWTVPGATEDGRPLVGDLALTEYRLFVDGVPRSVPASATSHDISVAEGQTVAIYIKACHAYGCSAPSETLNFTAPTAPGGEA